MNTWGEFLPLTTPHTFDMQTGTLDLTEHWAIKQGGTYSLPIVIYQESGLPYDFTGCLAKSHLRRRFSDVDFTEFIVTFDEDRTSGTLILGLTKEVTAAMEPARYEWDLFITFPSGQSWPVLEGVAVVNPRATYG